MKIDLTKLFTLVFLGGITYMVFIMLVDVQYLTQLVHAYISLAIEYAQH